jgi:hypothetical protein
LLARCRGSKRFWKVPGSFWDMWPDVELQANLQCMCMSLVGSSRALQARVRHIANEKAKSS